MGKIARETAGQRKKGEMVGERSERFPKCNFSLMVKEMRGTSAAFFSDGDDNEKNTQ